MYLPVQDVFLLTSKYGYFKHSPSDNSRYYADVRFPRNEPRFECSTGAINMTVTSNTYLVQAITADKINDRPRRFIVHVFKF